MSFKNLTKTFRYVNENGDTLTFEYDFGFVINKPEGIDTVAVSHSEAQGINQVGSTFQSSNVQSRPVTINGILVGDFQVENKTRLLSVIRPDLSAKLYADDYYLEVRPTATPSIEPKPSFSRFQFSLLAAYPYWRKDDSSAIAVRSIQKAFRLAHIDRTDPDNPIRVPEWYINDPNKYRFGEIVQSLFVNVTNAGQVPVPYTVTFTATDDVVNPKLIEVATNEFLLLNKSMVAGEKVVVEITHERTFVNSSVDGECRGALDLGSSFYRLKVGDNVIKPEATSGRSALQIDIAFATEIVGVAV